MEAKLLPHYLLNYESRDVPSVVGGYLRRLAALLNIAAFADGLGLFAGFAKVSMHQAAVTLPPASVFCVLYA